MEHDRRRLHLSGQRERASKVIASLLDAPERTRRKPEPAERKGHAPAMVRFLEALAAGERVLPLRIAGTALIAAPGEDVACLEMNIDRIRVVPFGFREQPDLAECKAQHQGVTSSAETA